MRSEIYVAEYSASQDCFNVETLERCVLSNSMRMVKGYYHDFIPIGAFLTEDEAKDFCNEFMDVMTL